MSPHVPYTTLQVVSSEELLSDSTMFSTFRRNQSSWSLEVPILGGQKAGRPAHFGFPPQAGAKRAPRGLGANPRPAEDLTRGTVVWGQLAVLPCCYPPLPVTVCAFRPREWF